MGLSIVIPALDAAAALPRTLAALGEAVADGAEVVVVDGGSTDGTAEAARQAGARVLTTASGRGRQLAEGARQAKDTWLLFLHADTVPGPDWWTAARRFMADPVNTNRAAAFAFALDDATPAARRLERLVALRCRLFALPYGDQGLLIHRRLYEAIGGFRDLPLMEDVDLIRRLGRYRLTFLDTPFVTSAVRFRREGYGRRSLRNLVCLALYALGVPLRLVVRLYG